MIEYGEDVGEVSATFSYLERSLGFTIRVGMSELLT